MDTIVNLTPHDVVVYDTNGETVLHVFRASGEVARVNSAPQRHLKNIVSGVPVFEAQRFTDVQWPKWLFCADRSNEIEGVLVSMPVGQQCASNTDIFSLSFSVYGPDTSPEGVMRDASGRILGTKRLVQYR